MNKFSHITNQLRLDATESAFFSRSLEHVRAQAFEVQYPQLIARSLVPVDNTINTGAQTGIWMAYDKVGAAEIAADHATQSPRVDVTGKEYSYKFRSIRASYGYSIQDIRSSRLSGQDLPGRKANAARFAIEQAIDEQVYVGSVIGGFKGLTNQTGTVTRAAAAAWSGATADQMLGDLNSAVSDIVNGSNGVEMPDTILMPLAHYNRISTLQRAAGTDTTVLKYFLGTSPYIKRIVPVPRLSTAGSGGTNQIVVYSLNPDKLQAPIPQEFEQFAPEVRGTEIITECHARVGGVVLYYPKSVCYITGS